MEVVWTKNAIEQYRTTYTYLLENAGSTVADKIADRIEDTAGKYLSATKRQLN